MFVAVTENASYRGVSTDWLLVGSRFARDALPWVGGASAYCSHALWQVGKFQAFGVLVDDVVEMDEDEVGLGNIVGLDSASEDPITLIVVVHDERTLRARKE